MTLTMVPVLEDGHDPNAVNKWTLDQLSWWYLIRARRAQASHQRSKQQAEELRMRK